MSSQTIEVRVGDVSCVSFVDSAGAVLPGGTFVTFLVDQVQLVEVEWPDAPVPIPGQPWTLTLAPKDPE